MFGLEIGFDRPWWLLLLVVVPLPALAALFLWWRNYRSLAGFGRWQRFAALALRTALLLLFVLALAEIQVLRTSERLTVIYLLDQSESVPPLKRQAMLDYVVREVSKHRNAERRDRAGVIVFGREAKIEVAPFDDDIAILDRVESGLDLRTDATNLESALKLAQASFPEDSARRIVIVTDGNENLGSARTAARLLVGDGVGIDVAPVTLENNNEVEVEKITLPTDVRKGQPIETRVVINNYAQPTPDNPSGVVRGSLRVTRQIGQTEQLLAEQPVELAPGKNVQSFAHKIDQPALYTYKAQFTPENPSDDAAQQNNQATAFTHVRGKGRVLLIEDWEHKGEFDFLMERLRAHDIEVDVQASDELFSSRAELLGYDAVILANVPKSSGDDAKTITNFSDEQIKMLVSNTEQMGAGLVMLGGPNSFGVGGWANTELEKAMPVDFQIKNAKVQAVGALALMFHASEMAEGNYWQKVVGVKSIETLGPMDYCGVIHFGNGNDEWLWGGNVGLIRVGERRKQMIGHLSRMTPGDMPAFDPAMQMALASFAKTNASVKHMIIISDGDPSPPSQSLISKFRQQNIQVSTVAIGTHGPAGSTPLQGIAQATGGKYYVVTNPKALPKIYQREARKVSRPLIYEPDRGVSPQITYPHEMLRGIEGPLPPVKGFVLTTIKEGPLVEQSIVSPRPDGGKNSTVLASWTYGAGRSVVLTTDAGRRWADSWTQWENYDKFFYQMIQWAMRPVNEDGKFTIATDLKDGKVRVVVTALDKDDEFLNFLNMSGSASGPDMEPFDVKVRQVAPGRYVGEFNADKSGTYFLTVNPGPGRAPLLTGVNVPYSSEYSDRQTNLALLRDLANLRPEGGKEGAVIEGELHRESIDELLKVDTFRHTLAKAVSSNHIWPLLILAAASVFFFDVLLRRVTISFGWLKNSWAWIAERVFKRQRAPVADERIERLRSRKAAVAMQLEERRAATRFEPQADAPAGGRADAPAGGRVDAPRPQLAPLPDLALGQNADDILRGAAPSGGAARPAAPAAGRAPGQAEGETYTERLMKAKKKAFEDRQ